MWAARHYLHRILKDDTLLLSSEYPLLLKTIIDE
jgi:hypothetical protein